MGDKCLPGTPGSAMVPEARIAQLERRLVKAHAALDSWGHDPDCARLLGRRGGDPKVGCDCNIESEIEAITAVLRSDFKEGSKMQCGACARIGSSGSGPMAHSPGCQNQ